MLVAPLEELRGPGDPGRLHAEAWVTSSLPDLRRYKEREPNALQPSLPPAAVTGDTSGVAPRPLLAPSSQLIEACKQHHDLIKGSSYCPTLLGIWGNTH